MQIIRTKNDFDFVKTSKNVRTVVGGRYWAVRRGPGEWCAHYRDSEPTFIG